MSADIGIMIYKSGDKVRLAEYCASGGKPEEIGCFDSAEEALAYLEKSGEPYEDVIVKGFKKGKRA